MVVKRNRVRASLWGLSRKSGKKRNSAVIKGLTTGRDGC